jgi:hypothetical protein
MKMMMGMHAAFQQLNNSNCPSLYENDDGHACSFYTITQHSTAPACMKMTMGMHAALPAQLDNLICGP